MKRILSLFRPSVIRAAIHMAGIKILIALAVLFLWDRLINQGSILPHSMMESGFFAAFIFFVIGAWLQYLSLDGMHPFRALQTKKKNRSITAMDEEELDEDEATAAKLFSNLFAAILFLIPSLIAAILNS